MPLLSSSLLLSSHPYSRLMASLASNSSFSSPSSPPLSYSSSSSSSSSPSTSTTSQTKKTEGPIDLSMPGSQEDELDVVNVDKDDMDKNPSMSSWSCDRVQDCLSSIPGASSILSESFLQHRIDGSVLGMLTLEH